MDKQANNQVSSLNISIFDIFKTLLKRKWLIIFLTGGLTFIALFLAFTSKVLPQDSILCIWPRIYRSEATIYLSATSASTSVTSALYSSLQQMNIPFMQISGVSTISKNIELLETIINSNHVIDTIASEFNFTEQFAGQDLDEYALKYSIRQLIMEKMNYSLAQSSLSKLPTANILEISFQEKDATLAKEILERILELVSTDYKAIYFEGVIQKKAFIKQQFDKAKQDFEEAQNKLIDFQEKYGSDIETFIKEQVKYISTLQADIYKHELELQMLNKYVTSNDPQIIRIQDQINQKKQLIAEIQSGFNNYSSNPQALNNAPQILQKLQNLSMDLELKKNLYQVLSNEYEKVNIEEQDNSVVFQVIDAPEISGKNVGVNKVIAVIITFGVSFFFSILCAFFLEYLDSIKKDPNKRERLTELKYLLIKKKKK